MARNRKVEVEDSAEDVRGKYLDPYSYLDLLIISTKLTSGTMKHTRLLNPQQLLPRPSPPRTTVIPLLMRPSQSRISILHTRHAQLLL
jgi:hypothetical protein